MKGQVKKTNRRQEFGTNPFRTKRAIREIMQIQRTVMYKMNTYRHVAQLTAISIITIILFRTQRPKREDSPMFEVLEILRKNFVN